MNMLAVCGSRIFQKVFFGATFCLKWRKPELLEGGIEGIPAFIKKKGNKMVLIVTDKGISSLGLIDPFKEGLEKAGVGYVVFDGAVANPTFQNVIDGYDVYKANACDSIVAFGGGSAMDCAKGIGARVVRPKKPVKKFKGYFKVMRRLPLFIAIPTTAGTGSETTVCAVLTDPDTHRKYACNDLFLIPHYAVLDPQITVGLPKHITSTTGVDALTHAVEAYVGHDLTKESRANARQATKLIFENLKVAYDEPTNIEARSNMLYASYLAGAAFTRSFVGYVHSMAHALGGRYGIPHGLANSVIMPYILDAYGKKAWKPLSELADLIGVSVAGDTMQVKAEKFVQAIRDLNAYMNIPDKLEGIKDEDIPALAKAAASEANPMYPVPRIMGVKELEQMYKLVQA